MIKINYETFRLIKTGFYNAGYNDYIASRFLLNNGMFEQGVTLASYAIERYMKGVLLLLGMPINKIKGHLDNFAKFERLYSELENDNKEIINMIDPTFKSILKIAYGHRYYDDIKAEDTYGFLVNQFLGELDYVVNLFETMFYHIKFSDKNIDTTTTYIRKVKDYDKELLENNYILHGIDKKEFMNRESYVFGTYVNKKTYENYIMTSPRKNQPGNKVKLSDKIEIELPKYTGQMFFFEMTGKNKTPNDTVDKNDSV